MPMIPLESATVRVMRSHDYCHFEVVLTVKSPPDLAAVDELRKAANRLADKAVAQYQVARKNTELLLRDQNGLAALKRRAAELKDLPESDLTPEDKAILKALRDHAFEHRIVYDYEDDFVEAEEYEGDEF